MGVIKLNKLSDHYVKLEKIFERTDNLIKEYKPDVLAIEAQFFGKNVQSMLKLGRAQGVAIAAALSKKIPVFEYSPRKIKQSITGRGNSSKEQVASMLTRVLEINEAPEYLDATDGLAVAVCHYYQGENTFKGGKYNSWKGFIKDNQNRVS